MTSSILLLSAIIALLWPNSINASSKNSTTAANFFGSVRSPPPVQSVHHRRRRKSVYDTTVVFGDTYGDEENGASGSENVFYHCDHVFDSSKPKGTFSFPFPPSYSGKAKKKLKLEKNLLENVQCIYSFVAGQRQRVKLEFEEFQLAGTADNCDLEYVDIYSELKSFSDDLLSSMTPSRYCGSVSPHIRISLHNVLILVFHSRVGSKRAEKLKLNGRYQFISNARFIPGRPVPSEPCSFVIDSSTRRRGSILSPTYPGTYPGNFHCTYLLRSDNPDDRIRVSFRDFDIYFGGEHCPYDMMTVYDGPSNRDYIIRKVCGLQQNLEVFSLGPVMFMEFNTTNPAKADPRGFVIDYEFSSRFVNVRQLLSNQKGVMHLRGTECDVRVQSNRETIHYIHSPNYPNMYPPNTTCTYIIDGLQGDQNLEKVVFQFETLNVFSDSNAPADGGPPPSSECLGNFIGVAVSEKSMKAVMDNTEESQFDVTLCDHFRAGADPLGPYTSHGPRMVVVFGSLDVPRTNGTRAAGPYGFKARVGFKTDFGIPGEAVGDSNKCLFRFTERRGSFNSPRYPANYPLDTNCTYYIQGQPGDQILLYFEQFALFEEKSMDECNDWLEIYDVFKHDQGETVVLQARYCWITFPGPTIASFGAHEMRVVFSSDSFGTANGFKAFYEIRRQFKEDVPSKEHSDARHCGHLITATDAHTSGFFSSPGFPVKYNKDIVCDWMIQARPGRQVLLKLTKMEVEGEMSFPKANCKNAIIRIHTNHGNRSADQNVCGTSPDVLSPIVSHNDSIRISFLTAPEKVNGLKGFNFTWTEVKQVQQDSECSGDDMYLCSYTRLCIHSRLKCDGDENCGENDDTDEAHCNIAEKDADKKTVIIAAIFSICIFGFIFSVFCFLFVAKYRKQKRKKHRRTPNGTNASNGSIRPLRQRYPYRSQNPVDRAHGRDSQDGNVGDYDGYIPSPATSRFVNHDAIGQVSAAPTTRRVRVRSGTQGHRPPNLDPLDDPGNAATTTTTTEQDAQVAAGQYTFYG